MIVKAYQSIELGGQGAKYTVQHAKQAQAAGCEVAFYFWVYAGIDGGRQVDDAMKTVKQTGIDPKSLLIDMESYTDGSDPGRDEIAAAFREAGFRVRTPWAYTAGWWWQHHTMQGTHDFSQYPLWAAQYDGVADLSVFTPFGGWTACQGKQYTGNPVDLSIISSDLVL